MRKYFENEEIHLLKSENTKVKFMGMKYACWRVPA